MSEALRTIGDVGAGHALGRYELLLPVATGGMAVVWAARLKGTRGFQKIVAVKTIRAEMSEDPQFEQMFLDEASLASRIKHPHVVEILDLGEEREVLYLVMEWIDGEPLHVIMKQAVEKGGIQLPIAVRIASQLCAGLHAAHEVRDDAGKLYGLVHRDVSPQNVLVTYDGVAKLVDFGVAKAMARGGQTAGGQVKGKVAYMAPEQARGLVIDRRTDIFALGIVLYTMTTGKHPFRRENDHATLLNITSDAHAYRPTKLVPGYSQPLEDVVMQALEKDPAKRFPTANEMLRALDHALPAAMRASTDEEVASFVRSVLGDRYQRRRDAIREALRLADDRSADTTSLKPFRVSIPSISGITPATAITQTDIGRASSGGTGSNPRAERWGADGSQPSGQLPSLAPSDASNPAPKRGLSLAAWVAIGALMLAAAATGGLITVLRSRPQPPAAPPAAAIAAASTLPSASMSSAEAIAPSALPVASAEPDLVLNELDPAANVPTAIASVRSAPPKQGPPPGATATATAPAVTVTSTSTVPQIRNPGF